MIKPLAWPATLVDALMHPVMLALGGFRRECVQETHFWHCQLLDPTLADISLGVTIAGDDPSWVKTNSTFPFPFFHAPALGGWRNYAVLRAVSPKTCWHVGWIHLQVPPRARARSSIHRLPLTGACVRVLKQAPGFLTCFVAFDADGKQIPVEICGEGRLGDGRHTSVRLF